VSGAWSEFGYPPGFEKLGDTLAHKQARLGAQARTWMVDEE
jgi:hypothetical protein